MNSKKLGAALAALAIYAIAAGSASAAAVTEDVQWYTGAAPGTQLSGAETVIASGGNMTIDTTVGESPLVLSLPHVECLECKIENSGGTAVGSGKLKFTGVKVTTPSTCFVNGGAVTTNALTLRPDYMIGTANYVLFRPNSGTTIATIKLEEGTGSCPLAGSYILSGTVFAKSNNATGVQAAAQSVTSSAAINTEAGGLLKFGAREADLTGTVSFSLSSGASYGTH